MGRSIALAIIVPALLLGTLPLRQEESKIHRGERSAPTYYLAVEARTCQPREIQVHGVSNLPQSSLIGLNVSDFDLDGSRAYSDEVFVAIDENGFFDVTIRPQKGFGFRRNLLVFASFTTYRPRQPNQVLQVVGRRGENLGDIENPQLGFVSGEHRILETLARVPNCGE